ncbi:MAG: sigma-70 family RNA polymerase sigma factor [Gemmatimonadetes bacterium]|nr:sigma-70 family RNA polymerase sigma factor [Gemmatimonadota bacterium]
MPALHALRLQHLPGDALTPGDGSLLAASAGGDRAAFDAFVARHQDALFRYLRTVAGNEADAEDALQEAFVAAWRGAGGFRGGSSARGWLFTIGRHAAALAAPHLVDEPDALVPLDALGLEAGWGAEPAAEREADEDGLLGQALAQLAPAEREMIVLRDLEGFSGEEAAELTGLTLAAMKTRLHRARLRLVAEARRLHA